MTIQYGEHEDLHKRVFQEMNAKEAPEVASHTKALALEDQDKMFANIDKLLKRPQRRGNVNRANIVHRYRPVKFCTLLSLFELKLCFTLPWSFTLVPHVI